MKKVGGGARGIILVLAVFYGFPVKGLDRCGGQSGAANLANQGCLNAIGVTNGAANSAHYAALQAERAAGTTSGQQPTPATPQGGGPGAMATAQGARTRANNAITARNTAQQRLTDANTELTNARNARAAAPGPAADARVTAAETAQARAQTNFDTARDMAETADRKASIAETQARQAVASCNNAGYNNWGAGRLGCCGSSCGSGSHGSGSGGGLGLALGAAALGALAGAAIGAAAAGGSKKSKDSQPAGTPVPYAAPLPSALPPEQIADTSSANQGVLAALLVAAASTPPPAPPLFAPNLALTAGVATSSTLTGATIPALGPGGASSPGASTLPSGGGTFTSVATAVPTRPLARGITETSSSVDKSNAGKDDTEEETDADTGSDKLSPAAKKKLARQRLLRGFKAETKAKNAKKASPPRQPLKTSDELALNGLSKLVP